MPHPNPLPSEGEASEWVDAWLWPEGEQLRWWTAADIVLLSRQEPARLLEKVGRALASSPVRLHLTEDWPVEEQRAFHDAVAARPILRERCQFILAVPRTAAPPDFPRRSSVAIIDLWPDTEREDGQRPRLFKFQHQPNQSVTMNLWSGISRVEQQLAHGDLSHSSLLAIIAHGSERNEAQPFRLADGRDWTLPPGIRLPPLVLLLACGSPDDHLVAYGRRLRAAGVQTVLAPTGRLDARPADLFLREFLCGWQAGGRVDELLWRAQRQTDSDYGAGRLLILGRGELRVGPARQSAELPDAELQRAARKLTTASVPELQALVERLTWQCYLQDGDLEGAVDALYEALDLEYDDRDRERPLLESLARHGSQWAPLTRDWVLPYQIYLAEIYDHSLLPAGSGRRLPNPQVPHACYHRAKCHYRKGAYPRAANELTAGLQALPPARWHQRSGLGLLGVLVNTLIDLNLPEPAQAALDQLNPMLSRASSASADRQNLNHWDRRARLALRQRQPPEIALERYRQKRQRDRRDPDRELAWLLYVAAWANLPEAPAFAAEVQAKLNALYGPDYVFGRGNEPPAYLLRALALWAWRSGDAATAAGVAAWTAKLVEPLGRVQDPGPFAMTLGYLHLYVQSHAPVEAMLPDWTRIADALERERYWFELASLACLLGRPAEEIRRALDQFQALRRAAGEELAGLPEPLRQRVMANWPALLERREAAERALLLAGKPAGVAELVKQGMLPL